jgi:hypothetical protein
MKSLFVKARFDSTTPAFNSPLPTSVFFTWNLMTANARLRSRAYNLEHS